MIKARLPSEEARPGCALRLLEVTSSFLESRRVTVCVEVAGTEAGRDHANGYATDVLALVQALNSEEEAGIAVLRFDAFDPSGNPLLQARWDLDLGLHSST